jgi:glutamyl-tRNA reductase
MHQENLKSLSYFFITGINYKKSDASVRGSYAINDDQYLEIINNCGEYGIEEFFILSTCNRTEIYGFAETPRQLAALLCSVTKGSADDFNPQAYVKQGMEAITHLFGVAAGLDSQILGDYEIIGQIKASVKFAKSFNKIGTFTERLVNDVLQSSKKIRTYTFISGGTVSVSFAAIQFIQRFGGIKNKNILLVGTGKFGSNTCKNLVDYLPGNRISVCNRTNEKARTVAELHKLKSVDWADLDNAVDNADIILVATHSPKPVVEKIQFTTAKKRLVIDLSIPCNVSDDVKSLEGITLVDVDELSKVKDETLLKRSSEIPKAKNIIAEHVEGFINWHDMRRHVPVLKAVKKKLMTLQDENIFDAKICISVSSQTGKDSEERIQKVINGMALKMKTENQRGCHYIQAINDFISPSSN